MFSTSAIDILTLCTRAAISTSHESDGDLSNVSSAVMGTSRKSSMSSFLNPSFLLQTSTYGFIQAGYNVVIGVSPRFDRRE